MEDIIYHIYESFIRYIILLSIYYIYFLPKHIYNKYYSSDVFFNKK